jgi:single-strand DNA-binding protein
MLNQIVIQGNVGNDPEFKTVKDNLSLATFSLAHTPRSQKNGRWEDGETMWLRVTQFGEKAEALKNAIQKGNSVIITGSLKQVSYKSKDGQEKQGLEINATSVSITPRLTKKSEELPSW